MKFSGIYLPLLQTARVSTFPLNHHTSSCVQSQSKHWHLVLFPMTGGEIALGFLQYHLQNEGTRSFEVQTSGWWPLRGHKPNVILQRYKQIKHSGSARGGGWLFLLPSSRSWSKTLLPLAETRSHAAGSKCKWQTTAARAWNIELDLGKNIQM